MVRICCVHPAITEEREKTYKKRERESLWGAEKQLSDHRQWKKQHALLHTCMHTCTHMHMGCPSWKRAYGHAAMHGMRWARDGPARRDVAAPGAQPVGKRSAPRTWQLLQPSSRVMWWGRRVSPQCRRYWHSTSCYMASTAGSPEQKGARTSMLSRVRRLKHSLTAQEMKNLMVSTLMMIILSIYTELHVKAPYAI